MKRMDIQKMITCAASGVILVGILLFLIFPKQKFSEQENRYLEGKPSYSEAALLDGSYVEDWESYLCDHFPFRDAFMNVKAQFEKAVGKQELNDVYLAKDGYLIEKYKEPLNNEKIIRVFNSFAESIQTADVKIMLVPTAITIYSDRLPNYVSDTKQEENRKYLMSRLTAETIDVEPMLMQQKEQYSLYYRLDHHWTTYGAYVAYQVYCEQMGLPLRAITEYQVTEVTDAFKGTIYSKVNDYSVPGDTISLFEIPDQKLQVFYADSGKETDTPYALEYLEKKDKYSLFLDNIHPLVELMNENSLSQEEIIVVKDSYANCFVPFLTEYYRKVYVVDTRYYKTAVSQFINDNPSITQVLILYNMNTIDTDLGIGGIY